MYCLENVSSYHFWTSKAPWIFFQVSKNLCQRFEGLESCRASGKRKDFVVLTKRKYNNYCQYWYHHFHIMFIIRGLTYTQDQGKIFQNQQTSFLKLLTGKRPTAWFLCIKMICRNFVSFFSNCIISFFWVRVSKFFSYLHFHFWL